MKKRIPGYFKLLISVLIVLGILVLSALLSKINALDIESNEVQDLYALLGDNYLDYCDGLPFYKNGTTKIDNLSNDTKMCMAYKLIDSNDIEISSMKQNKKKTACNYTKEKQFRIDDDKDSCSTEIISSDVIEKAYNKLFGTSIKSHTDFELSGSKSCFYDEEKGSYTCGNLLVQTIELGWTPTTYRMITGAKKKGSKILIYDYYLAINNNRCYITNTGDSENKECEEKINEKTKFTSRTLKKYGQKYLHTFAEKDGKFYWESTTSIK